MAVDVESDTDPAVAQRDVNGGTFTLIYMHGDHLGSVSVVTNSSGGSAGVQEFDPWGKVRSGGTVTQTKVNFTGQKLDQTGLLYYHARMYDSAIGRFVSPDSIVPGASSGVGGAGGILGQEENSKLTVDFRETGLLSSVNSENYQTMQKGFWFQLDGNSRQRARTPFGPSNSQGLNRYSYVLNNPLRYKDPTGHVEVVVDLTNPIPKVYVALSNQDLRTILDAISGPPGLLVETIAALFGSAAADKSFRDGLKAGLTILQAGGTVEAAVAAAAAAAASPVGLAILITILGIAAYASLWWVVAQFGGAGVFWFDGTVHQTALFGEDAAKIRSGWNPVTIITNPPKPPTCPKPPSCPPNMPCPGPVVPPGC